MFLNNYIKIIDNDFIILRNNNNIIIVEKNSILYDHVKDENIKYKTNIEYDFENKEIFKILATKKDITDKKLKKFINNRNFNLIGHSIEVITNENNSNSFCDIDMLKFASMYAIDKPIKVKLEIIEVFNSEIEFDKSKSSNDIVFGIWLIEKNFIDTSFLWKSTIQVKMCSPDFFNSELKKGSLFLKMKMYKI